MNISCVGTQCRNSWKFVIKCAAVTAVIVAQRSQLADGLLSTVVKHQTRKREQQETTCSERGRLTADLSSRVAHR